MDTKNPHRLDGEHAIDWAARLVDGRVELAKKLDVSVSALGNWKVRGVPVEKCVAIERCTGGVVTRKYLRPEDWPNMWPELAQATIHSAQPATETVAGQGV